jgi:hypothetical protein
MGRNVAQQLIDAHLVSGEQVADRKPVVERASRAAAEYRTKDHDDHNREHEGEELALRVAPERQLLGSDLVPQQRKVASAGGHWYRLAGGHHAHLVAGRRRRAFLDGAGGGSSVGRR